MIDKNRQISVLLPVHNSEKFLAPAIDSILNQTWSDLELVILDDGSTDSSWSIIHEYAQKDHRVRPYKKESTGLIHTLNQGLALCKNELIARMDADDISLPDRLERQRNELLKRPTLVLLGSSIVLIDESGCTLKTNKAKTDSQNISRRLLTSSCVYHPTAMFRKSAVLKVGGYRSPFKGAEDYDLWLRLREVGEIDNLASPLLHYRVHPNSVTSRNLEVQALSTASALACSLLRSLAGSDLEITNLCNAENFNLHKLLECVAKADKDLDTRCERSYYRSILYSGRRPERKETENELDKFLKEHTPENLDGFKEYKEILQRAAYFSLLRREISAVRYIARYLLILLRLK